MMSNWLPYALGYGYAVVVGHVFVSLVVGQLWRSIGLSRAERSEVRPGWWLAALLGVVERGLFVAAFLHDAHAFIGVWLAMKVAGQWKARVDGITLADGTRIRGHSIFMIFLIGSGLSVAYAGLGASIILRQHRATGSVEDFPGRTVAEIPLGIFALALVAASLILWLVAYIYRDEYMKDRRRVGDLKALAVDDAPCDQ